METTNIDVKIFHVLADDGQWVAISLKDWTAIIDMLKTLPTVNVVEIDMTKQEQV